MAPHTDTSTRETLDRLPLRSTSASVVVTVAANVAGGLPALPLLMYVVPWTQGLLGLAPAPDYGDPEFASAAKVCAVLLGFVLICFVAFNASLQRLLTGRRWSWWLVALASAAAPTLAYLAYFQLTRP
ncbi:hypothetical protein [Nocardioides plantarum]|uniref:DUF2834 domain-containing protein n=1 Tax=Nocardioides plantarum TaxID=29299 RepID=A0ABV5K5V6_9ACTN|nr:hypothetical protein [Nocardioides plantarum]